MFNIFDSNVFIEIGEAIGDAGGRLLRPRRKTAELVDEMFRRRLTAARSIQLAPPRGAADSDDDVIDVPYQVLSFDEEDQA